MDKLLSLGLDVGTTTTQLVLSQLEIVNRAGAFAVPEMEITGRRILHRSAVYFTPMTDGTHVDGDAIRDLVEREYEAAGITKDAVDTGAVIITGETSRKENAAAVLTALSGCAGDFVAATAGPDLESVLAAKGAGATAYSRETGKRILHMDIGGGTANLALIEGGKILRTGCFNVGGRLIRTERERVVYVSPVLDGLTQLRPGDPADPEKIQAICHLLTQALEMAAGRLPPGELMQKLTTWETVKPWEPPTGDWEISFSGGVADCIGGKTGDFGDIGAMLGQTIRKSRLCQGDFHLGRETIGATVIGAGCHSAQLTGSTIFCRDVPLPMKNLPVAVVEDPKDLPMLLARQDGQQVVLAFPGTLKTYGQLTALARILSDTVTGDFLVCLESDMAKALGQQLRLLHPERPCLCIDRVSLREESYLDIGKPVGSALPVIVKTLILGQ